MGCVCCSLSSFISIALDACERITLCTVCALLTCCLLFTLLMMLVIGIGVGYHYCFVQNSVESMGRAAKAAGNMRSGVPSSGPVMRSLDRDNKRGKSPGFSNVNRARRTVDEVPPVSNNNTRHNLNSTFNADNTTIQDLNNETNYHNNPNGSVFIRKKIPSFIIN